MAKVEAKRLTERDGVPARRLHPVLDETEELTGDGAQPDLRLRVSEILTVPG